MSSITQYSPTPLDSRLVHFLICGTQKGGTTALHEYLKGHPDICMSAAKELHFFDNEEIFQKGPPDYSEYHAAFSHRKPHQRIGESTPIYMYWDPAPKRIKEYNPQLKLIVLLRNPIERAYAHWNMERARGADKLSFWDAIQNEPQRIQKRLTPEHRVYSYVDRGFYLSQLERLWAHFPRSRVLVLKHEDLRDHPQTTLRAVTEFLGVSPFKEIHEKKANATPYLSPLTPVERKYLHGIFEEEIHKLERVLKWDCSQWLKD